MSAAMKRAAEKDPLGDTYTGSQLRSMRAVFVQLADWADADGVAWRPVAGIAAATSMSRRHVQHQLKELEAIGRITAVTSRKGGRGLATRWRLTPGGHGAATGRQVLEGLRRRGAMRGPRREPSVDGIIQPDGSRRPLNGRIKGKGRP